MTAALCILSAVVGGAWRRWEGAHVDGFLGHRWLKLSVAFLMGFLIARFWTGQWFLSLCVSGILATGWTPPAQFGGQPIPWALVPRYGFVTVAVSAISALIVGPHALTYAPIGCLSPLGYMLGRRVATCWTCVGETWLGATMYGFLFLLR